MRSALTRLVALSSYILAWTSTLSAHVVEPAVPIYLRPGGEDWVFCYEPPGETCFASITVTSNAPGIIEVHALDMVTGSVIAGSGVSASVASSQGQVFRVRAAANAAPIGGSVTVCWNGIKPCTDKKCPGAVVPVIVESGPSTGGSKPASAWTNDPVNAFTGELALVADPDFALGGPLPLVFQRLYASRLAADGNSTSALGTNWRHGFDWRLAVVGNNVEVYSPEGRVIRFERSFLGGPWMLAVFDDQPFDLKSNATNWKLGDPESALIYTFDPLGKLTSIEDHDGNKHTLGYVGSTLTSVSDGLGRTLSFAFTLTAGGTRLTSVSDGPRNVDFGYDGSGRLETSTDAGGAMTTYAYDPAFPGGALMTSLTRPKGNVPYMQTWDAQKRVATQTDALGNLSSFAYGAKKVTSVEDPLLNVRVFDHDKDGALEAYTDESGKSALIGNNAKGQRISITDRLGGLTSWKIHAGSGQIASLTEADGSTTDQGWVKRVKAGLDFFDLASVDHPDGKGLAFQHDNQGNVTDATDRAGKHWSFTYGGLGQVLTATNPRQAQSVFTYNGDGTLATATDASGNTTAWSYDALRRPTGVLFADGESIAVGYDALDRVTSFTDELDRTTAYTYDSNGNLVVIIDPSQGVTSIVYDLLDRPVTRIDPEGNSFDVAFDQRGKIATLTNGSGDVLQLGHNARGWWNSIVDGRLQAWSIGYDAEGLPIHWTDPLGNQASVVRDARGRVKRVVSPLGRVTKFNYDALDRITKIVEPKGNATTFDHEPRGLLKEVVLPIANGTVTAQFNALGQPTQIDYPFGRSLAFAYDTEGRMTRFTDPLNRTTNSTYDSRNRIDVITLPGGLGTIDLTWNEAGELTDRVASDGTTVHYDYDVNGLPVDAGGTLLVWDDDGRLIESDGIVNTFDAADRLQTVTFAPGKVVTYTYDAAGRLDAITDWLGGTITFTYDAAGRLVALSRPNGLTTRWTYDADSRPIEISEEQSVLAAVNEVANAITTFNKDDLITQIDFTPPLSGLPPLGVTQAGFDAAGQKLGTTCDARGNLLVDGQRVNTWDLLGRLTDTTLNGNTTSFGWNGFDHLSSIITQTEVIGLKHNYALFGQGCGNGISIITTGGQDSTYVVRTPNGWPLLEVDAQTDQRFFFHTTPTNSTRFLSDDAGSFSDAYELDPFGATLTSSGSRETPFRFHVDDGSYFDVSSKLTLSGRFVYDASSQRLFNPRWTGTLDARAANPFQIGLGNPQQPLNPFLASSLAPRQVSDRIGGPFFFPSQERPRSFFFYNEAWMHFGGDRGFRAPGLFEPPTANRWGDYSGVSGTRSGQIFGPLHGWQDPAVFSQALANVAGSQSNPVANSFAYVPSFRGRGFNSFFGRGQLSAAGTQNYGEIVRKFLERWRDMRQQAASPTRLNPFGALTERHDLFWFFQGPVSSGALGSSNSNLDTVVRVLNGSRFAAGNWVFVGTHTDVPVDIRYAGEFAGFRVATKPAYWDTDAFATCP